MKRKCLLASGVALVALIASPGAMGRARHHSRCHPAGAKTIAKDRDVRVYSVAGKPSTRESTYACLLATGATMVLNNKPRQRRDWVGHIVLTRSIVAYTESSFGVDSGCTSIVVVDVVRRHAVLTVPSVACSIDAGIIAFGEVTDLVVSPRGSVAWIVHRGNRKESTFQVHDALTSGASALLDEALTIVQGSLRLSHGTVSWENAGRRKSAPLP
jgi:hypothetical protein